MREEIELMDNQNEQGKVPVWALKKNEIKKPDPKWKDKGIQEIEQLYILLSTFGVKHVEHIGSISIHASKTNY